MSIPEQDPRGRIGVLEAQVRELRAEPAPHDTGRIGELEQEIDQLWDLARQQGACREAGESPAEAEGYLQ